MGTALFTTALLLLSFHATTIEGLKWRNKEQVEEFFDGAANNLQLMLNGEITTEQFAEKLEIAQDFEEYIDENVVSGKSEWISYFGSIRSSVKAMSEIKYEIDYWTRNTALVKFDYIYKFLDDTELTVRGHITTIWNDDGELSKWIYFSDPDYSFKTMSFKAGQVHEEYRDESADQGGTCGAN